MSYILKLQTQDEDSPKWLTLSNNTLLEQLSKIKDPTIYERIKNEYPVLHMRIAIDRFCKNKDNVTILNNQNKPEVLIKAQDQEFDYFYIPHDKCKFVFGQNEPGKTEIIIEYEKDSAQRAKIDRLYNDQYVVTDHGVLIDLQSCKTRNPYHASNRYIAVTMNVNNQRKHICVHRLVAHAFCPKPERHQDKEYEDLVVNHIDGVKVNNHYTNLEWCTDQENTQHAVDTGLLVFHSGEKVYNAALTNTQVKEIRDDYVIHLRPYRYYIEKYNVKFDVIQAMLNNESYFDPNYKVPQFIGKRKITFTDAQWIRSDKQANPKNTLTHYAALFGGVDLSTIGKILQNKLHPDPNYDPSVNAGKQGVHTSADTVKAIVEDKKNNPTMSLAQLAKKYNVNDVTAYNILKRHGVDTSNGYTRK